MQGIGRVTFMEDDLPTGETAPAHVSPQGATGVVIQPSEQAAAHDAAFLQGALRRARPDTGHASRAAIPSRSWLTGS